MPIITCQHRQCREKYAKKLMLIDWKQFSFIAVLLVSALSLFYACEKSTPKIKTVYIYIKQPIYDPVDTVLFRINFDSTFKRVPVILPDGSIELCLYFPSNRVASEPVEVQEYFDSCKLKRVEIQFQYSSTHHKMIKAKRIQYIGKHCSAPNRIYPAPADAIEDIHKPPEDTIQIIDNGVLSTYTESKQIHPLKND